MENMQNQFLISSQYSSSSLSPPRDSHPFMPLQHRYPEPLMSPYLQPTHHKLFNLPPPTPIQKQTFKLIDEADSSSFEDENSLLSLHQKVDADQHEKYNFTPLLAKNRKKLKTESRTTVPKKQQQKNEKGLRILASNVYSIVLDLQVASYKQVAERLLGDFNENYGEKKNNQKNEQNIKRRVYDALNVLISASIIQKKGKLVMSQKNYTSTNFKYDQKDKLINKLDKMNNSIKSIKGVIEDKTNELQKLRMKEEVLRKLVKRNEQQHKNSGEKIKFPLIGIICEKIGNKSITFISQKKSCKLNLPFTQICGDVDFLILKGREEAIEEEVEIGENVSNYLSY